MTEHTLRTLLKAGLDRLASQGVPINYRYLEEEIKKEEERSPRGLSLNRTTIGQIINGTYKKVPTDGTIRGVAFLTGVDDAVAYAAAGRREPGPPFAAELPTGVDQLSPKERTVALDFLRFIVEQRKEIDRYADLLAEASAKQDAPPQGAEVKKKTGSLGGAKGDDPAIAGVKITPSLKDAGVEGKGAEALGEGPVVGGNRG